jgi:hypothetical protein
MDLNNNLIIYYIMRGGEYMPSNNSVTPPANSTNEFVMIDEQRNNLLGLGFETEELEMIEHMPYDGIVRAYVETADQDYNINLPDINAVIQAVNISDVIAGTEVTKRDIASQTMHNLLQEGGRKKQRRRKTRKIRKNKKSRRSRRRISRRRR